MPDASDATGEDLAADFMRHRPRLLAIAYRLVGSAWDAEDIVAEAAVRWLQTDRAEVREPVAFLSTVVTRLALDLLRSARATRETYVGEWLPEPVITDLSPFDQIERRESVSLATLRMMETLSPPERAVLVLHEAFGTPHAEIAATLGITEPGARQHLRRARHRISGPPTRFIAQPREHREVFERFLDALDGGDLGSFESMLTADVVSYSDGGGKARAARHPVVGADAVGRFFGSLRRHHALGHVRLLEVNGRTAALLTFGGQPQVLAVDVRRRAVSEIHSIMSPDKLSYLRWQLGDRRWTRQPGAPAVLPG